MVREKTKNMGSEKMVKIIQSERMNQPKLQLPLVTYALDVLSHHQWNLLYLLIARDIEDSPSHFLI